MYRSLVKSWDARHSCCVESLANKYINHTNALSDRANYRYNTPPYSLNNEKQPTIPDPSGEKPANKKYNHQRPREPDHFFPGILFFLFQFAVKAHPLFRFRVPFLTIPTPLALKHGYRCIARVPHPAAQQPIRQAHKLGPHALLPVAALLGMLDGVRQYPPLGVKVEDEEARKGLVRIDAAREPQRRQRDARSGLGLGRLVLGPALLAPAHDELLRYGARAARQKGEGLGGDALGEDLEPDVADDGDAVPGDGRGPEGGGVGDAAGDGGEVRVRRGEEAEGDVGGENVLRERGLEERREVFLEDPEGWRRRRSV